MATRAARAGILLLAICNTYGQQYFPPAFYGKTISVMNLQINAIPST
jgi:hypothetical protein